MSRATVNAALALASLHTPVEVLRRKVAAFERKRAETAQRRSDFAVLLEAEVRRLAEVTLTEEATAFRDGLTRELQARVGAESGWSEQSGFYYKFRDEPVSLKAIQSSLMHALPRFPGDALISSAAQPYGRELADTRSGRVRHDFAQRLDGGMRELKASHAGTYRRHARGDRWRRQEGHEERPGRRGARRSAGPGARGGPETGLAGRLRALACQARHGGFSRAPAALPDIVLTRRALQILHALAGPDGAPIGPEGRTVSVCVAW